MKSQQLLIHSVQEYLSSHGIPVSLPSHTHHMDIKVNLRITDPNSTKPRTSTTPRYNLHRYQKLMQQIQTLLTSSSLDLLAIQSFMIEFNKVINSDIDIMNRNQVTRVDTFRCREKLMFRIKQIGKKTQMLMHTCSEIQNQDQVVNFIASDLKVYINHLKMIASQYNQIQKVQVLTPFKIDNVYEYEAGSDEDYADHYQPLLQILVRLKANMNNLQNQVKNSSSIDMPLKSVNLLANCKNLLQELQPFLIAEKCAFNRLIFHVVNQQTQNMRLISGFYSQNLKFAKSLVYVVYKCVYLVNVFPQQYQKIKNNIETQKKKLIDQIVKIHTGLKDEEYAQIAKGVASFQKDTNNIMDEIKIVREVVCFGKSSLMEDYLQEKICKNLCLLTDLEQQMESIFHICKESNNYIIEVKKMQQQSKALKSWKPQIRKYIQKINQSISNIQGPSQSNTKILQLQMQKMLKTNYINIQQSYLRLSQIQRSIIGFSKQSRNQNLASVYFFKLQQNVNNIKDQYFDLETQLLNSYKHLMQENDRKQQQAEQFCDESLYQIQGYLLNQDLQVQGAVYSSMGPDILNEDTHANAVKEQLQKIIKSQYLFGNCLSKQKNVKLIKLQKWRGLLELLLAIFQESMDEAILQSYIDKMDFQIQSQTEINKTVTKMDEFLSLLKKYIATLIRVIKDCQTLKQKQTDQNYNTVCNKITKISKQRILVYQFLYLLYGQCMTVFADLKGAKGKIGNDYDIESKGVTLLDENLYKYVLRLYCDVNKISVLGKQLNDASFKQKTKNYLNDDIYEPYFNRLVSHLKYREDELLNLVLRLQKAIFINKNCNKIIRNWEDAINRGTIKTVTQAKKSTIQNLSQQLVQMADQIQRINQLGNKSNFVVLNPEQISKIQKQFEQHFRLSRQLLTKDDWETLPFEQYENPKILQFIALPKGE